jgi:hypothetical protein
MDQIGVFTPEQARLLWQDYQTRQQLPAHLTRHFPQRRPIEEVSPHRVFVRNDSGEEIPEFACMQITGTATVGDRTVVTVTKPTSTDGEYLFNSQYSIAIDERGWAYRHGVVVMLGDPPSAANVQYLPMVGAWTVEEGDGPFIVFGDNDEWPDSVVGRFAGGTGGTHEIWFEIVSVACDPYTSAKTLTVNPTWYTGGCTKPIPGADSYGYVDVEDVCSILEYYTAEDLIDAVGRATYMYPRTGECVPKWLVDTICKAPECA